MTEDKNDGIHGMVPREKMDEKTKANRDFYAITPNAPLRQCEFGFYCKDEWIEQGLAPDTNYREEFGFNAGGSVGFGGLGWCEAAFNPTFESKIWYVWAVNTPM